MSLQDIKIPFSLLVLAGTHLYPGLCYSSLYICPALRRVASVCLLLYYLKRKRTVKNGENKLLERFTLPSVQHYKAIWSTVANMIPHSITYDTIESTLGSVACSL